MIRSILALVALVAGSAVASACPQAIVAQQQVGCYQAQAQVFQPQVAQVIAPQVAAYYMPAVQAVVAPQIYSQAVVAQQVGYAYGAQAQVLAVRGPRVAAVVAAPNVLAVRASINTGRPLFALRPRLRRAANIGAQTAIGGGALTVGF